MAEPGLSAFILPAIAGGPNTPGNVAGSLPPGTAGSHRLPGLTRANPCKRAEQSPTGQKLGVERITGNKSIAAHTSLFPPAPSFTIFMSPRVPPGLLTVPLPCPVPPRPGFSSQVRSSHPQPSAPAPALHLFGGCSWEHNAQLLK